MRASALPSEIYVAADVQSFPGSKIIWVVAPASRMAVTAAWTVSAQRAMLGTAHR